MLIIIEEAIKTKNKKTMMMNVKDHSCNCDYPLILQVCKNVIFKTFIE